MLAALVAVLVVLILIVLVIAILIVLVVLVLIVLVVTVLIVLVLIAILHFRSPLVLINRKDSLAATSLVWQKGRDVFRHRKRICA